MCELARALVSRCRSMNIATFSTRNLREQGRKSYVASYRANEDLSGDHTNVFLQTSMKIICESFLLRTIPNIRYNMGTRDLPDIDTHALRPVALRLGHTHQVNPECPCYNY